MDDIILEKIAIGGDRPSGLLFHGTGEAFDTALRPGGYDGVLWTAEAPSIAQTYIPRSGTSSYVAHPGAWLLGDRVPPEDGNIWYGIVRQMGFAATEREFSSNGQLSSWRLPPGYPTYADAMAWLAEKGYALENNGSVEVIFKGDEIMPASWSLPGRLFVTLSEGLRFFNAAQGGEGDLMAVEYHNLEMFREVEAKGYDGVIINDFMQDDAYGNVGHRSFGLFAATAARLGWVEIPAQRRSWSPGVDDTEDYAAFRASLGASLAP